MLERDIGLYGWQGQAAYVYVVYMSFRVTLQIWTLHPTVISELFCLHCVGSSGRAQIPSEWYCPIHPLFPPLFWQESRWPMAGTEVPHRDQLLPGPPSTANSETQESTTVKYKFTHFITVNHTFTSTWGCSHYEASLRLRFGFHA